MATAPEEMEDLSKMPGALLVNFGTIESKESMMSAGRFANLQRKPGRLFFLLNKNNG
jgi:thiamine-phosphate diphosphorylase / hydroxyethylthiazole kinase